jgi:hypothetical protein
VKSRSLLWFSLAQLVACGFVFGAGLWGGSLLAPLDIAPALFSKYKFVNPESSAIPANHYDIDQLLADLPLQYTMYRAYHQGEVPWWDPFTLGGMPLLADAHCNGTDFVRLLMYACLPFELAYNWTRILHFVLSGLGMFLLLRRWNIRLAISLLLSLAYEFAGCFAVSFQHPWIESTFMYYPYLWLVWDQCVRFGVSRRALIFATLLMTGILYSGSIQTHTYLGLFFLGFGLGCAGRDGQAWGRLLSAAIIPGLIAFCLASPVLGEQVELFFQSSRPVALHKNKFEWLCGIASLSGIYPWGLGTFRTLDLSKFLGQSGVGFQVFVGSTAFLLAGLGIRCKPASPLQIGPRRTACLLIGLYLLILSSPLLNIFYVRCAPLAVMGLVVLGGIAIESLLNHEIAWPRAGRAVAGLAVGLALITNAVAWVAYPHVVPKVKQFVLERESTGPSLDTAPLLRVFQVENLPREISFQNPETVLACASLLGLAAILLRPAFRKHPLVAPALLLLNLLPVLSFCHRYVPRENMALWHRLRAGGPEQQKVMAKLSGTAYRLLDIAPGQHDQLMPGAFGHLYRVRTLHGWSSLRPPSLYELSRTAPDRLRLKTADWVYESKARNQAAGEFERNGAPGLARFQWQGQLMRRFQVEQPSLNRIRLTFESGPPGVLLWTDTWYPGWQATAEGRVLTVLKTEPCSSQIEIPAEVRVLDLRYEPLYLRQARWLQWLGVLGIGITGLTGLTGSGRSRLLLRQHVSLPDYRRVFVEWKHCCCRGRQHSER